MSDLFDVLTDFVEKEMPQYRGKKEEVKYALAGHYQFNTLDFDCDGRGITYLVRFNIMGDTARILDFCVREDLRGEISLKKIIIRNWARYPLVTKLSFVRGAKYPYRKERIYEIGKIIKE